MEWFKVISDALIGLLGVVAWPLAVFSVAFLFRNELRDAFERLTKFKYRDLEADFGRELEKAEAEAEASALPDTGRSVELLPSGTRANAEQLFEVTEVSPRAAVLLAWTAVEHAAHGACRRLGISEPERLVGHRLINAIADKGELSDEMMSLYDRLRKLRNEAAHARDFDISREKTQRYIQLVLRLVEKLDGVGKD